MFFIDGRLRGALGFPLADVAMGFSKSGIVPPVNIPNPHQNRLTWVVHLPQKVLTHRHVSMGSVRFGSLGMSHRGPWAWVGKA